jgi:hypothetical protein
MGTKRGSKQNSSGTQHNPKGVTQGVTLVCPSTGDPIDCIQKDGKLKLAVDATATIENASINVDLDFNEDSVEIGDSSTGNTLHINSDGSIDSNTEVDAEDGDNIAISAHPLTDQIFDETADTITSAAFEEIYSFTSTSSKSRIKVLECFVSTPSLFRLKIDGVIKKQKSSSPTERNITFTFEEHRQLVLGKKISIEAQVDRFIHGTYETFVSLEGYKVL